MSKVIKPSYLIAIAPMLGWTNRHFRYFVRLMSYRILLYSEMVTTPSLLRGRGNHLLTFNLVEHPVALQLAGADAKDLAICAKMGEELGYDEINLNVGCPSQRIEAAGFGATLMDEPLKVAEIFSSISEAVQVPVTIKSRLSFGTEIDEDALYRFTQLVAEAGCQRVIFHARGVFLQTWSARKNRSSKLPLYYDALYQLQKDFPHLKIILNGGIKTLDQIKKHLNYLPGVMVGRAAYKDPYNWIPYCDRLFDDIDREPPSREEIALRYLEYVKSQLTQGVALNILLRPLIGLYHGEPFAKEWRGYLTTSYSNSQDSLLKLESLLKEGHLSFL